MRRTTWLFALMVAAALVIVGCDGDGNGNGVTPPPNGGNGGFDATVYDGTWTGQWINQTFSTQGPATMQVNVTRATGIAPAQTGTADVELDLGGNVFGQFNPAPVNVQLNWDENGAAGNATGTQLGDIAVSVAADGDIQADVTNIPLTAIDSVSLTGTSNASTISLNYTVNFAVGQPATGVVDLSKQS